MASPAAFVFNYVSIERGQTKAGRICRFSKLLLENALESQKKKVYRIVKLLISEVKSENQVLKSFCDTIHPVLNLYFVAYKIILYFQL